MTIQIAGDHERVDGHTEELDVDDKREHLGGGRRDHEAVAAAEEGLNGTAARGPRRPVVEARAIAVSRQRPAVPAAATPMTRRRASADP